MPGLDFGRFNILGRMTFLVLATYFGVFLRRAMPCSLPGLRV